MINLDTYLIYLLILLLPVFPYSKIALIVLTVILIGFIKVIKIVLTKKIGFNNGFFDVYILLFVISYIISTLISANSIMEAILNPGTTSLVVLCSLFYFLANQMDIKDKSRLIYIMISSMVLYSIYILVSATRVSTTFQPASDYIIPIATICPIIPIMIGSILKQTEFVYKFLIVVSIFISIFSVLVARITFPNPNILQFSESSNITINSLKGNPLFGVGPGNYIESFSKFRSIEYNNTPSWSIKFSQASSFVITNLTENGLFGSITFFALFAMFINYSLTLIRNRKKVGWGISGSLDILSTLLVFIALIALPLYPVSIFNLFILLALITETKNNKYQIPSNLIALTISIPIAIIILVGGYKTYFLVFAEYHFTKGVYYLSQNKAKDSYEEIKQSINLNPKVDKYHRTLSAINFAFATSISQNKSLDDNQKQQISLLLQEAINEAKASVSINNKSAENWEFLAKTYHLLIPFTNGADQFAIDSYKQAIALDPINPNLRIKLGEIYMIKKDYKNAIETFNLAVLAKENHPNAHFNLAIAYKENGELTKAKAEFIETLSLIPDQKSKDYELAKKELAEIESKGQE